MAEVGGLNFLEEALRTGQECSGKMEGRGLMTEQFKGVGEEEEEGKQMGSCTDKFVSLSRTISSSTKPSWLLSTLAVMDERMKMLSMNFIEVDNADTFAERAESYYQKRPQLLSLLQDLYKAYQILADRYCQTLAKHHHLRRLSSQISYVDNDYLFAEDYDTIHDGTMESDAESSLSFQPMKESAYAYAYVNANANVNDGIVAELVMKTVECEIMAHEIGVMERQFGESSRKMELQKSLLEVLESERLILLTENARLGYRVAALAEENEGLAAEAAFMKRKAGELARCVLKMRDDHRVCMLSRKIEDLQTQIYGLEKRNKDYCDRLVDKNNKNQVVKEGNSQSGSRGGGRVNVVTKRRVIKWWERVKNFDVFMCAPHPNSTYC